MDKEKFLESNEKKTTWNSLPELFSFSITMFWLMKPNDIARIFSQFSSSSSTLVAAVVAAKFFTCSIRMKIAFSSFHLFIPIPAQCISKLIEEDVTMTMKFLLDRWKKNFNQMMRWENLFLLQAALLFCFYRILKAESFLYFFSNDIEMTLSHSLHRTTSLM